MTRYADPQRCPDCGQPIDAGAAACSSCGLPLRGQTAAQLFQTLTAADALLATLRASAPAVPVASPVSSAPASAAPPAVTTHPGVAEASAPRAGLSAASVPKILLGLGAACLLIAALVFLAVTWSVMGVGGRTATLVGFTVVTAGLAAWMARRDLRAAAEALSLVALGLLTLDAFGAREAGWLADLGSAWFLILLGALITVAGAAAVLAARRSPIGGLTGVELVTGLGVALMALGVAQQEAPGRPAALVLAVLVAGGSAYGAYRLALPFVAAASGLIAVLWWLAQFGYAVDSLHDATLVDLWMGFEVWQLLASAALAGVVLLVRAMPPPFRVAVSAVSFGVMVLAAVIPALDESPTSVTLAALGALAAAGVVGWLLPRPWGLTAALTQAVAGVVTLAFAMAIGAVAAERLIDAASARWAGATAGVLVGEVPESTPAAWLLPLCIAALLGTLAVLGHASLTVGRVLSAISDRSVIAGLLAASGVGTLATYSVPVWAVVAVLLVAAVAFLTWWSRAMSVAPLVVSAILLAGGVTVGWYDEWLTVASLTTVLLSAGAVHLRARQTDLSAAAGAVVAAALAGSVWTWGTLVAASEPWVAAVGLVLLGASVLTLHLYPPEWWSCASATQARAGFEVGAAGSALPLALAGVMLASESTQATWTAVNLTIAGAAVTALSLVRQDRHLMVWPGGALLALASWVRLWDIGVREPEPYTLPTAAVLLVVGLVHLRRHPSEGTTTSLAPGLVLALLPSLMWVLADPTGLRSLLLGVACFGLVLGGVQLRWAAPVTLGAAAGALLVLRLAAPYVDDAVPRWVLIGSAGAILILTGVTWERRLREARQVVGYVRGLR